MKKLKIFLLLSILLCFGFMLSSEVHAEDDNLGFKLFEEGEVLPMGKIEINVITTNMPVAGTIYSDNNNFLIISWNFNDMSLQILGEEKDFELDSTDNYFTIDTSNWSLAERTISFSKTDGVFWRPLIGYSITFEENGGTSVTDLTEQTALPDPLPIPTKEGYTFVRWYYDSSFTQIANAGDPIESDVTLYAMWRSNNAKIFEVGDELPAGYIKISWDFTGLSIYLDEIISIKGTNDFVINLSIKYTTQTPIEIDIMGNYTNIHNGTITIILYNISTITEIKSDFFNGIEHTDFLDALVWEVVPLDDLDFLDGYMSAREEFGYYDPNTNEWLSVTEYINRYGTDKPGQSDFYANFDKYFIPAMIIVFGGAIVLTILKVFKGRE